MQNIKEKISVPYGCTVHGDEEIEAVVNVLRTSTQMGKHVNQMERRVADLFAKNHGIMVNSGSTANYLAIEILNLPAKSEVITPALTFSTTVAPLVKHNLIPVFVDVEPGTYNIDASRVEAMISDKTSAMMIPNLLGNLPDWIKLKQLADKYNLITIQDSADTLGATINGEPSGIYANICTTSFYGSHVINCAGNGGMLCCDDASLEDRAKLLRSWGRSSSLFNDSEAIENRFNVDVDGIPYDAKFLFEAIGYNVEPSEMGAAFGLVQLTKLQENIKKRNYWFNKHLEFFKNFEEWFILPKTHPQATTGWLAFPLTIKKNAPFTRTEMQIYLEKCNIQTRTIFTGNILRQPGFKSIERIEDPNGFIHTEDVMKGGILIACHHGLDNRMFEYLDERFMDFIKNY